MCIKRKNAQKIRVKSNKKKDTQSDILSCVPRGTRTLDPLIKSQLLYQLS